jgi:acyl-CoA thioesterase II
MDFDDSELSYGSLPQLVEAITSAEIDPGPDGHRAFETKIPDWWMGDRTFGGMVVAQALHAATRTVSADLDVHSLHGYFLRPSRPGMPSIHRVETLRDGRSFTTREVTSEVEGRPVFRMICQFHAAEEGDEYQLPMAPAPLPSAEADDMDAGFPFVMRELGATEQREDGSYLSTRRLWFRTNEEVGEDRAMHACLLAYLSDMTGASFRPLSMGTWGAHTDASLDHAVWFHRPWRADRWSLFDLQALVNAGGRATVRATMHGEDGTLHLSMAQELLIRKLDVPMVFETPPWADRDRERRRMMEGEVTNDGPA